MDISRDLVRCNRSNVVLLVCNSSLAGGGVSTARNVKNTRTLLQVENVKLII